MSRNIWVHGDYTYRGVVIQVLLVESARKGRPRVEVGWKAKIDLDDDVEVITTRIYSTPKEAEMAVIDACHALFTREA